MKAQFKSDMNGGGRRERCARLINKSGDEARAFLGFVCSFVSFALIMCFYFKLSVQQNPPPPPKAKLRRDSLQVQVRLFFEQILGKFGQAKLYCTTEL